MKSKGGIKAYLNIQDVQNLPAMCPQEASRGEAPTQVANIKQKKQREFLGG